MQLIQLVTTHFKKLGSVTIDFTPGLNVLAGANARGKSSALQAIKCALFGVSMVPGKKEFIATWGQKKFEVELTFRIGETFKVTRSGSTAKLICTSDNDRVVANGTTPVNAAIEDLLGLASKDYGLFIESAQGESTGILTFGAAALNRKVEEFAGVDLIDKVQALATQRAATYLSGVQAKRPTEEQIAEADTALEEARSECDNATAALIKAQEAVDSHGQFTWETIDKDPDAMRAEQQAEERLWAKVEQAEKDLKAAQVRVAECEERCKDLEIQDAEAITQKMSEVQKAGEVKAALIEQIQKEAKTRHQAEVARDAAGERAKASHNRYVEATKVYDANALPKAQKALTKTEAGMNSALEILAQMKAKQENLTALADGAQCPTCGHVKEDHDPAELAAELEAINADVLTQSNAIADDRKEVARLQRLIQDLQRTADDLKRMGITADEDKGQALEADKHYEGLVEANPFTKTDEEQAVAARETLREEYASLKAKLSTVRANNEKHAAENASLDRAKTALVTAQDDLAALTEEYEALPTPPTSEEVAAVVAAIQAYRDARAVHSATATQLAAALTSAQQLRDVVEKTWVAAQARRDRFDTYIKEADELEAKAKQCTRLAQFLRERRQKYLEEVWGVVLGVSSTLVNQASFGLVSQILNRDGEFLFVEDGIEAPTSSASGAQRSFIGTALRVGLARALYGSDGLLIFDEPTEACTEENAAGMAAMLASSAKQVLLITHRENDQSLAENIINIGE